MKIPGWYRLAHLDRQILSLFFGFDKWHIQKVVDRLYVKSIIDFLTQNFESKHDCRIVEIGAGLGDIIRNVPFETKYILDYDQSVLNACKFLSNFSNKGAKSTHFQLFNFPNDALSGQFDVVLLVNWIHTIEPEVLLPKLQEYFDNNLKLGGYMIVDSAGHANARFNHNFSELLQRSGCKPIIKEGFGLERKVFFIQKLKD